MSPPLLFAVPEYTYLRDALCALTPLEPGKIEARRFPDGERYLRILSDVAERHVVLLGGTINDDVTLALYDLACAAVDYGAGKLTLVVPYFGYGTMERAGAPGEVVTAKTRARLLSAIPIANHGNRVLLMDLHSEGIPHYFEGATTAVHMLAKPLICEIARKIGGKSFVLGSTDAGRAKWVAKLANELGVDAAFIYKRRLDGETTEVTAVNAAVEGCHVVIYDDMIRTGSSLLGAGRGYREAGASALSVIATHGLFPGDALDRLSEAGLFGHIVCTDSHPRARSLAGPKLQVASCAAVIARELGY